MKAPVNGIQIDYRTDGPRAALPVVFVHGFPFHKGMWELQIEALRNDHHVVTYDVRGHGGSEVTDYQFTVEMFVDDLIGLLDHIKLSSVVIAGLSMGGYIALRAIERHPERFRGLILCDTRSEADGNEGKIKRANQVKLVKSEGMEKFIEPFVKGLFSEKTFQTKPDVVDMVRQMIRTTSPSSITGTLIALAARTDTSASLFQIKVPTLILVGQHDGLTPPSASHAMKEKIPRAEMHIIPKAGHVSNLENPTEFNEHLLSFLKKFKA